MKMLRKVKQWGYCCPFAFLIAHPNHTTKQLSEMLEVSPRTVRWYKQRIRARDYGCEEQFQCVYGTGSSKNEPMS